MAKFIKIGAGWNNEKGNINIVIEEDITAGTKTFLLKNQYKEKDKQPDWILKRIENDDMRGQNKEEAPF